MKPESYIEQYISFSYHPKLRRVKDFIDGKFVHKPLRTDVYPLAEFKHGVRLLKLNTHKNKNIYWKEKNMGLLFVVDGAFGTTKPSLVNYVTKTSEHKENFIFIEKYSYIENDIFTINKNISPDLKEVTSKQFEDNLALLTSGG
jgi:hypothetical protein